MDDRIAPDDTLVKVQLVVRRSSTSNCVRGRRRLHASIPRGARAPRSPATSPAQYPAGSGVGVSVLLREADGSRASGRRSNDLQTRDLRRRAPVQTLRRRKSNRRRRWPRRGRMTRSTTTVAHRRRRLVRLSCWKYSTGLELGSRTIAARHVAVQDAAARHAPRRTQLDIGRPGELRKPRRGHRRLPGLVDTADDFHVLCDIARAVSRRLRSRRERLAPTARGLRGLRASIPEVLASWKTSPSRSVNDGSWTP